MTLTELEACFLTKPDSNNIMRHVQSLAEADGIWFLCPKCYHTNGGKVGTHAVICWFKGKVPDDLDPKPGRWNPSGTGLNDLTFVPPGSVSVLLRPPGCGWHGYVTNGEATLN